MDPATFIGANAGAPVQMDMNMAREKAEELEGVFLNTLMSQMFSSIKTDGMFGGGQGEDTWRSMQSEQYANLLAQNGGIGLADQIMADLLLIQENANQRPPATFNPTTNKSDRGAY